MDKTTVEVFGAEWCSYCNNLKKWLNENNISFIYRNVDDENVVKELESRNVNGIPYTIINKNKPNEEIIQGFNPEKFRNSLK